MWKIFEKLGGRKMVGFLIIFTTGVVFQSVGHFDATFSYFLLGLLGVFGVANAASKFGGRGE